MKRKQICFVIPYPVNQAPSQRFRFEQYLSRIQQIGFDVAINPFFAEKEYREVYQSGNILSKLLAIAVSYARRCILLFRLTPFDFVFIHREATPAGPPVFEYISARLLKKKIIYDFDDAIWLTDKRSESVLARLLRCRWKVRYICKWSYRISCGNRYLAEYAARYNSNVSVNPTTIDTVTLHNPDIHDKSPDGKITIGWTGSRSTLKYLEMILPALQIFERKYPDAEFLVIADKNPRLPLKNVRFKRWNRLTEIQDLAEIDIGLMPMPDDPWTRGKAGFKALQYMAMEIPALVSPAGVNKEIVQHGVDGYWCSSFDDWFKNIEELMFLQEKRKELGRRGRKKVTDNYSVTSNSANFLSLFQ